MAFSTYKTEMPKVEKYPFSEKKEMITLNKRLADYITKVEHIMCPDVDDKFLSNTMYTEKMNVVVVKVRIVLATRGCFSTSFEDGVDV